MRNRLTASVLFLGLFYAFLLLANDAAAEELSTNEVVFTNPPSWLNRIRVNKVVDRIQATMEWDIHRVRVQWYLDQATFQKFHGFDASVLAISRKQDNTIHLGPRVIDQNFDAIFGHELVHTIVFQKYKDAIPNWLNEGLANYVAREGQVDYAWLNSQPFIDVRTLVHPFEKPLGGDQSPAPENLSNTSNPLPTPSDSPRPSPIPTPSEKGAHHGKKGKRGDSATEKSLTIPHTTPAPKVGINPRYHYQASTALIEMIAAQCSLDDLLQLSVGKKLESYLTTYCSISDVNASFRAWVKMKSTPK